MLVLGALMLAAIVAGSGNSERIVDSAAARMQVETPTLMREGVLFETRVTVVPRRDLADLRLGFSPGLWRDFTINTIVPAASEEKYEQGLFLLDYGPLRTGEPLVVKIDGQINPVFAMLNRGEIALFDGDRRLASLPLEVRVLP